MASWSNFGCEERSCKRRQGHVTSAVIVVVIRDKNIVLFKERRPLFADGCADVESGKHGQKHPQESEVGSLRLRQHRPGVVAYSVANLLSGRR